MEMLHIQMTTYKNDDSVPDRKTILEYADGIVFDLICFILCYLFSAKPSAGSL